MTTTKKKTTSTSKKPSSTKRSKTKSRKNKSDDDIAITFDTLGNSFSKNLAGTISFFLMIIAIVVFLFAVLAGSMSYVRFLLKVLVLGGVGLAGYGIDKKPNGLAFIAGTFFGVIIVIFFIIIIFRDILLLF